MELNKKEGQIALIILLAMVVVLTIGLSLVSRSVTDVKISTDEKEAYRAFSAAEAGIEDALNNISLYAGQTRTFPTGDINAQVTADETGEGATQTIERNDSMNVVLASVPFSSMIIDWTKSSDSQETSTKAGLEVTIYKDDYSDEKYAFGAFGDTTHTDFQNSVAGSSGFYSRTTISVPASARLVRLKPLFNKASIKVTTNNGTLPVQQYDISSKAASENKQGAFSVTRTVSVLPNIFDYTLFSGGGDLTR